MIMGTAFIIFPSGIDLFRQWSEYSFFILLGLLGFSMVMMVLDQSRLMFAGLICAASLALFLKNASNTKMKFSDENMENKITVAHINLTNIDGGLEPIKMEMMDKKVDVISFQELTPDWKMRIEKVFFDSYPHRRSMVRIDPYGMMILSKYPFSRVDTFMSGDIPGLVADIRQGDQKFKVISSYLMPAIGKWGIKKATNQLKRISQLLKKSYEPTILLGDFNMVYWSEEIINFRRNSHLINSRRGLSPMTKNIPYDHIFFTPDMECIKFEEMRDSKGVYQGILGRYQLRNDEQNRDKVLG